MFIAVVFCGLLSVSVCWAGSEIPNLVGDWVVKAEGGVIVKGAAPGPKIHYKDKVGTLNAEVSIASQQGRIV